MLAGTQEERLETIAVIGAGIMGRGIAHVAAMGGFKTILNDVSGDLLNKAKARVSQDLQQGVTIGKVTSELMQSTLDRLQLETDLDKAAQTADMVIE